MSQKNHIKVVLFDVGGVLVELSGVPTMLAWMGDQISPEQLWKMWLTSPAVRAFETGRISPEIFANQVVAEMSLQVGEEQFLKKFPTWIRGLFPGALDLVGRIPRQYTRATLCNSNAIHWPLVIEDKRFIEVFDHHFASHLIGKIKPDEDAFQHVTGALGCGAAEVLFLDDNQLNTEAAERVGMRAVRVKGVEEAERALVEFGVVQN